MIKDKYLTAKEAGRLLGFTADHVRRLILNGKIKAEKFGYNWFILPRNIMRIKRQRKSKFKEEFKNE